MVGHTTLEQLIQCYNMRILDKFLANYQNTALITNFKEVRSCDQSYITHYAEEFRTICFFSSIR